MMVVYVKYCDPVSWFKPYERFYADDLAFFEPSIMRVAGILLKEDEKKIIIGEVTLAEDNEKADEWGVKYPNYRYLMILDKSSIIERQEFEIKVKA